MENRINKGYRVALILSFIWVLVGLALCINYFFVPGIDLAEIIANVSMILAFAAVVWYMLKGYKLSSDVALGIPLFMYAVCVIIMVSTTTVSISGATPFITAAMCSAIVYPIIIAFQQKRAKLCVALFALIIFTELAVAFGLYFTFAPEGILSDGSLTETLNNVHIFVRSFLTSALLLCYGARVLNRKN